MSKILAIFCLNLALCGCAARHPVGVNYFVPPICNPSVHLIDCDHASPPRCKKIAATFTKNCEQLMVAAK